MQEQLISFETAKLAKEKGFDEICYVSKWWDTAINHEQIHPHYKSTMAAPRNSIINNSKRSLVSAPTQSLLHKWLIEEKNFFIVIHVHREGYSFNIHSLKPKTKLEDKFLFSSILEHMSGKPYYQTHTEAFETALLQTLSYINGRAINII